MQLSWPDRAFAWLNEQWATAWPVFREAAIFGGGTPFWWLEVPILLRLCPPEGWPPGTTDLMTATIVAEDGTVRTWEEHERLLSERPA